MSTSTIINPYATGSTTVGTVTVDATSGYISIDSPLAIGNNSTSTANIETFYGSTTTAEATNTAPDSIIIPSMRTCAITGIITAMSNSADGYNVKAWEIKCIITRDNNNNTRIVGIPTIAVLGNDTDATNWNIISITADNTNESLVITVSGEVGTTIKWQGSLFYGQVGY